MPDLFDSWYLAEGDAMDNSAKHERTVGVASTADGTARYTSKENTRCVLGTKGVVPSVLDLLKASSKAHVPIPKAISIAQDAAEASPASIATKESECNDNDEAAGEARVSTALAVGIVDAASVCAPSETSPDAHTPLETILRRGARSFVSPRRLPRLRPPLVLQLRLCATIMTKMLPTRPMRTFPLEAM